MPWPAWSFRWPAWSSAGTGSRNSSAMTRNPFWRSPMSTEASGVIHDLGYQRYEGGRLGRLAIIRTLAVYSVRAAFGLGRGAQAKVLPVSPCALWCAPAGANAYGVAQGSSRGIPYDTYIVQLRVLVMTIFV